MASAKIPQLEESVKHFSPLPSKSVSAQVIRLLNQERDYAYVQLCLHPHSFAWAVVKEGLTPFVFQNAVTLPSSRTLQREVW